MDFEYPDHAHKTVGEVLGRRPPAAVVSDDDLCASCRRCSYRPGERSTCAQGWPGDADEDGYCTSCQSFEQVLADGPVVTDQGQMLVNAATGVPIRIDEVLAGHCGHYRMRSMNPALPAASTVGVAKPQEPA